MGDFLLISERIFALIDENGMTQKEFSERTGISQSTISDWKRKKTNPAADKILKICEVLHINPYELLAERDIVLNKEVDYMVALNEQEAVVLESFRNLPERKKERVLGYLKALQENM